MKELEGQGTEVCAGEGALDVVADEPPPTPKRSRRGGGPRTAAGKKVSAKNAVRFGILSADPLAGGETLEDWERHRQGFRDALQPGHHYEDVLVDDIALNRWQHARLERASNSIVAAQIELASMQSRSDLEEAFDTLPKDEQRWLGHDASGALEVLELMSRGDTPEIVSVTAAAGVKTALDFASTKLGGPHHRGPGDAADAIHTDTSLTKYADDVASTSGLQVPALIAAARADAEAAADFQAKRAAEDRLNLLIKVASANMLSERQGALHGRYKTALDKAFDRYVNMLETSQLARSGELSAPVRFRVE
jgi:hypothetical protein